ncbi:MAG TPA: RNA polymerase sigma factor [Candidatus Kapabacteria bacterium]|nr:RNA polymerase sigma factor [Candidatus Kapabacteria bacterium]
MTLQSASEQARDHSDKQVRFMALLEPCLAKLSRYCHAMTKDADDRSSFENGRDLLSDAILLAYENFEKLRAPEAFTSYIFTTARRLYYRSARRKKFWGIFPSGAEEIADERGTSPEVKLDLEALDRALAKLPEKQREAVVLFEISGLSLVEIREIQGGSLSGVKSRIVRGREKLAVLLGAREQPGTAVRQQAGTPAPREANSTSFERAQVATLMREKL